MKHNDMLAHIQNRADNSLKNVTSVHFLTLTPLKTNILETGKLKFVVTRFMNLAMFPCVPPSHLVCQTLMRCDLMNTH